MTTACLAPNGMSVFRGDAPAARLLVGTAKGVAVFERAPGADWKLTGTTLDGNHISSLLIEPVNGGLYAGIHRGGVFFSPDLGRTWEARSTGLSIEHVYSLVSAVANGKPVVYAGTEPPSLFHSADEGRTWDELPGWRDMPGMDKWVFPMPPKIPHAKTLAVDPRDSKTLYVGVEQAGLFTTSDGGQTWRELDSYSKPDDKSYRDVHQIALRPNHPDEIYMTTGMGLYRSLDAGDTWKLLIDNSFRIGYPDHLIISPLDGDTMFMAGAEENPGVWQKSHHAGTTIVRTRDCAMNWTDTSVGFPENRRANIEAMSIATYPGGFTLFAGTTDGDVFASDNDAQSWDAVVRALAPVSKGNHYRALQRA